MSRRSGWISNSGMSYRSASTWSQATSWGIIDSPTANRGWVAASASNTFAPLRARTAPRVDPAIPDPRITTS
ncbi:hypothetical protein SGLAM104S_09754 [Streptomyces glaucescens]